ncbi:ABC transporter ATP-binding protein [Ancylobacter dichloromethanicus]|uniref:Spermidine/putrescine import ATP-binding protein PotA n=1 Tax=Ancylobacter dichloromethanicus TaxID=518825 RepID=A0A9W6N0E3_9HYPH|nr:ABC transporter ATP-binding protein [Ancylobacter dichloromethanicus]MBS7553135.1 ABC transporter ATP-binding protein [Ancylobacter dichloromethanicus]GLK72912.1 polyamine-transporting ATPase [Ancylobacter dichloromethanicus]
MKLPVSASESFVEFAGVQKTYDGEVLVVKDLSLRIRRGEFLTLLGPSGSGKTTTLMMLAGFETPTSGDIMLDGARIDALPPEKRNIGMVFQNYALFPHMSVAQNVGYPLKVRGRPKAEIAERVARALDMVHLGDFAARMPGQLSGGQQQRVALARALVFEPKLVLMDEPLGALDKQLREHMQMEIRHLHERLGITVVYVTHDQSEALTMSDRVAVFNAGVIQQVAPPSELYESPANSFVAQFIGENNRLPGRVEAANGTLCTVVLANGDIVAATLTEATRVGRDCLLSIRPERVKIAPPGGPFDNHFEAQIAETIYLGDHVRVRCVLDSGAEVVVKVGNADDRPVLVVGSRIPLGWRAQDCRALDAA